MSKQVKLNAEQGQVPAHGKRNRPIPGARDAARQQQSLSKRTYERIKEDIITCALPPGTEISEASLSIRYRTGKAPIRWALATLSKESLVSPRPRRGYMVAPVTLQDVRNLFELRLLLEPHAASLAAGQVDPERLRNLEADCEAGYRPGDRSSEAAFLRANKTFHVTIAKASGNQRLAAVLEAILEEMERLFHLGLGLRNRSEEMHHEHAELVDALIAGDDRRAEKATVHQIKAARDMVLTALLDSAQLKTANISFSGSPVPSNE